MPLDSPFGRADLISNEDSFLRVELDGAMLGEVTRESRPWREWIDERLAQHGALLFRKSGCENAEDFAALCEAMCRSLASYDYASTPRTEVKGGVYTSTEYPPSQEIPLHNEMSYTSRWPSALWFFCEDPADSGGATPIADSHRVWKLIDPAIRHKFESLGVRYVRNYNTGVDLTWQQAFQSESRDEVERRCKSLELQWAWNEQGGLRTWQRCDAVLRPPQVSRELWFNQAHLFHTSSLRPEVREALETIFAPEDLPRNAFFGDGSVIEDAMLDEIRGAYSSCKVPIAWQAGDVVVVDNQLVAHGRDSFTGSRRVLVAMEA